MISVDWTLFLQIANFVVLILILNSLLYKPIRNILKERKQKVRTTEEAIETAQRNAAESDEAFKAKMSEARMRGQQEKEAFKQAGQEEEKRIVDEIHQKTQADMEGVKAQIAKDAEDAKVKLEGEIKTFSAAIAEKILGRAVS